MSKTPEPDSKKPVAAAAAPEKLPEKSIAGLTDDEKKEFAAWGLPYKSDGTEFGLRGVVRAIPGGGTKFVDKEEIAKQSGVMTDLLKSVGSNIISGKSVINISLPVRVFEPRSFLERMTDIWCFAPLYLRRAALCKDPIERFKWVITCLISGLHRGVIQMKPFNPIMGETWQCEYQDGTQLYFEQVAHHPPVSAFEVVGPNKMFYFHGSHEYLASMRPSGVWGGQKGDNVVEFLDGTRITFPNPTIHMTGLVTGGDRTFNWSGLEYGTTPLIFSDAKNNLKAEVRFNPDQHTGFKYFFGGAQKTPQDCVRATITHLNPKDPKNPPKLSEMEGSWLDGLVFDGIPYWTMGQFQPFFPAEVKGLHDIAATPQGGAANGAAAATTAASAAAAATAGYPKLSTTNSNYVVLASDSRYRADLIALKKALAGGSQKADMDNAQKLKETLEVAQRQDRKLRKELAKHPNAKKH